MKKIVILLSFIFIYYLGFGKVWTIENSGSIFSPDEITITIGDSVEFILGSFHSAIEVDKATWEASENVPNSGFATPLGGGLVLPEQLTIGTHYYVCENHYAGGMKGIIIVEDATHLIESSFTDNLSIFPNPSNGVFNLQYKMKQREVSNYDLVVYNMLGEKVFTKLNLEPQISNSVDLSIFPKGAYFIKLLGKSNSFERKIIIN